MAWNKWWMAAGAMVIVLVLLSFFLASLADNPIALSNKIAIVPIQGEISSSGSASTLSALEVVDALDEAENDPTVSAILLDIDSPGGSIVPTKQIVAKGRELKKPVVSYIGDSGASGAYYVAASSDYIFSDADSITGSIGVISIFPNLEGLLEKIGVKFQVLKVGENKDIGSPFSELNAEQRQIIQTILDDAFSHFKSDVLLFRSGKVDLASFDAVADGRILSGQQAKAIGLVDALGTRNQAIQKAGELAGISGEPIPVDFGLKPFSLLDLFSVSGKSFGSGFREGLTSANVPKIQS